MHCSSWKRLICIIRNIPDFQEEVRYLLKQYSGRPTSLYYAERLTQHLGGAKIYLKREDLNHTGAHKINNAIGQAVLAKRMGKKQGHRRDRSRPARRCYRDRRCACSAWSAKCSWAKKIRSGRR